MAPLRCVLPRGLALRALGRKVGYPVMWVWEWALWEAPGKKEGCMEWEAHEDLKDLEDTLKKSFLAQS